MKGENTEEIKKSKENARTVAVEIEVENFYEITTDDDDAKSGDSESNQSNSSRKKKKKDNLAKFERKMT